MSYRAVHSLPGPAGPPGAGGGAGGSTTYVQTFAVPDTTWTVTHPLDTITPSVEIFGMDGTVISESDADVRVPDNQTVIVSFAVPVAGRVKLAP